MAQQDACTLLDDDHNEVIRLFEQYKAAHDGPHQQLLAARISQELTVHMRIRKRSSTPRSARPRATKRCCRIRGKSTRQPGNCSRRSTRPGRTTG
ncbi:MAG: hypothetical protein JWQ13_2915 [Ramlibacter sp.]|nr:hypothetical protein [Ramlibacter sp.]